MQTMLMIFCASVRVILHCFAISVGATKSRSDTVSILPKEMGEDNAIEF